MKITIKTKHEYIFLSEENRFYIWSWSKCHRIIIHFSPTLRMNIIMFANTIIWAIGTGIENCFPPRYNLYTPGPIRTVFDLSTISISYTILTVGYHRKCDQYDIKRFTWELTEIT